MPKPTTHETTDTLFSSYVVTCTLKTTRFFITPEFTASDILARAKVIRWADDAQKTATLLNQLKVWHGFTWTAETYAQESLAYEKNKQADYEEHHHYA